MAASMLRANVVRIEVEVILDDASRIVTAYLLTTSHVEDIEQARAYGQSEEVRERQRAAGLLEVTHYYPE